MKALKKWFGDETSTRKNCLRSQMSLLPIFDHSKVWKMRGDRPPRRKVDYGNQRSDKHSLSRQSSRQNEKKRTKKSDDQDEMETESNSSSDTDEDDAPLSGKRISKTPSVESQESL